MPAQPAATAATPATSMSMFERMRAFAASDDDAPPPSGEAPDVGEDSESEDAGTGRPARAPAAASAPSSGSMFERMRALSAGSAGNPGPAQDRAPRRPTEKLIGMVERIQLFNGTWGVIHVWTQDRRSVKVTGEIAAELREGLSYEFEGEMRNSSQHGESLAAVGATPHVECDRAAITRFIARSFKGVGERKAESFVRLSVERGQGEGLDEAQVLERLRKILVTSPWTLDLSEVSKKGQYDGEQNLMMVEAVKRDLSTRIGRVEGVKDGILKELASWLLAQQRREQPTAEGAPNIVSPDLVDKCWARLAVNPYKPIGVVSGYGFKTADALGRALNIPREDPKRIGALAAYAVSTACQSRGHMFLHADEFEAAVKKVDPAVDPSKALKVGLDNGEIVERPLADNGSSKIYYEAELHEVEDSLARRLARMLGERCRPLSKEPPEKLREKLQSIATKLNPNLAGGLDKSQLDALVGILTSRTRVHTLTAGPGCGKTSMMEVLTAYLGAERFDYCAPTGRAAQVLSKRLAEVGGSASTIHSLFRGAGRGHFQVNEDAPLESAVLVVDEGSMPSASLWDGVLAGMNDEQHLIVLGDVGQLPSIEPGKVLDDLLRIQEVDRHRLTASHRAQGGLLEILGQIDRGTIDCKDREDVTFSHGLPLASNGFQLVAEEYLSAVREVGYSQIALLMSRRKGEANAPDWNVTYANARLREMCNPSGAKVPGTRFHENDRILLRENLEVPRGDNDPNEEEGEGRGSSLKIRVVNGDTGTVTGFTRGTGKQAGAKWLRVKLDDGRDVHYPTEAAADHAYAITVHSAQGGEYRRTIAVVTSGHESFVNQVMLRTQASRARQHMKVHADDAVLRRVAATPMPPRNSRLAALVRHYLENEPETPDEHEGESEHTEACRA